MTKALSYALCPGGKLQDDEGGPEAGMDRLGFGWHGENRPLTG